MMDNSGSEICFQVRSMAKVGKLEIGCIELISDFEVGKVFIVFPVFRNDGIFGDHEMNF